MNYSETLNRIEKYMEDSGIRKFCVEVCKGACCKPCKVSCTPANRKLTCSTFICGSLRDALFNKEQDRNQIILQYEIKRTLKDLNRNCPGEKGNHDVYFGTLKQSTLDEFEIPERFLNDMLPSKEETKQIRKKVLRKIATTLRSRSK